MRTQQASNTLPQNPAAVVPQASTTRSASDQHGAYNAWTARRRHSIADLVDDQDALADWHRNLARLRAEPKD